MAEEELRLQLENATTYEERAAIRRELRKLKQSKGATKTKENSTHAKKAEIRATPETKKKEKKEAEPPLTEPDAPTRKLNLEQKKTEDFTKIQLKVTSKASPKIQPKERDSPSSKVQLKKTTPRDYSSSSKSTSRARESASKSSIEGKEVTSKDIQQGLAVYINRELATARQARKLLPVPSLGSGFYKTCSNPLILCSLVNLAVRNTVDLRALSSGATSESNQENLTLALESARSIGCYVDDDTHAAFKQQNESIILKLLIDLLKARLVHSPGAEKLGRNIYDSPALLLGYYGIHIG